MLGKGLESLIPPHRNDNGSGQALQKGQGDGRSTAPFDPQETAGLFRFMPHDEPPSLVPPVPPVPKQIEKPVPPRPPVQDEVRRIKPRSEAPKISQEDHIFHIEIEKIKPNPSQPRRHFSEDAVKELAYSIREFGFLQPLVVTKTELETASGVEVAYELIAGERRLRAAQFLGLAQVPAIVRNIHLEREKLELAVIENIQREDLNPIETARALARLQDEFRLTQREIAAKLGKSREVVANTVRLLSLPMYVQEALEKQELTESHGRLLLSIEDPASQKKLFDDILFRGMTTRELKERVHAAKPRKVSPHDALPPEVKMMEEKLTMELGTPVKIEHAAGTGKIVITFYSEEELESIVHKIGKEES